ncbi:MAG: sensor histidine kinase [Spirochaetaceae bacterium]|nr:MAG: sensor histidine kinase [Spirochaetaceae bacterium]
MLGVAVLSLSTTIQYVAAVTAALSIRKTHHFASWALLSAALFLMAVRRTVSIYNTWYTGNAVYDATAETVALVISILMLLAVLGLRSIFSASRRRETALTTAVAEHEILAREVNHRVKNSLSVISSLLSLQEHAATDPTTAEALRRARTRLNGIVVLYEMLHTGSKFLNVHAQRYIHDVAAGIADAYGSAEHTISYDIVDEPLDVRFAQPIGIIVNELVTNALKHAFPDGRAGKIAISMKRAAEALVLTVSDDGVGIADYDASPDGKRGFGRDLVQSLVEQLSGTLTCISPPGTTYTLTFPAAHSGTSAESTTPAVPWS